MGEWPNWTDEDYKKAHEEDCAALAAYFAAHPDLLPFQLGDKVLITDEARYRLIRFQVKDVGQTATVDTFAPDRYSQCYLTSVEAQWLCTFPINLVLRMRQAYLDQQTQSSPQA